MITDYVEIAGVGAALCNAAALGMLGVLYLKLNRYEAKGKAIMAFWLLWGFALFGKNLFNVAPIVFGGWLYSRYKKEPFVNHFVTAILSTSLAPAVSQVAYSGVQSHTWMNYVIAYIIGIVIGFVMTPIAENCMKSHDGYNLYNVGFSAGIVGILVASVMKGVGIEVKTAMFWNTTNTALFGIFLVILSAFYIWVGFFCGEHHSDNMSKLMVQPGKLTDFYALYGEDVYINMGLLGLKSTFVVAILQGDLNGPTIGGIFTVIGFGVLGKHIKNCTPVMLGAIFAGAVIYKSVTAPSIMLAILFGTCLAPIAGRFGFISGFAAGFLHVNVVLNVGVVHGGLNLYNNGFSAGFVAMLLVPLIVEFRTPSQAKLRQMLENITNKNQDEKL